MRGLTSSLLFQIASEYSNNQAEYEALLKGLQLLKRIEADAIEIFGDSMLIVKQVAGEYECRDEKLKIYLEKCMELIKSFKSAIITHIPREQNCEANALA